MDERTQGAMLLAVGGVALRLGLTDAALSYVKAGLQIPLTVTGVILLVLGANAVLRAFRESDSSALDHAPVDAEGHAVTLDDGHGHGLNGPTVAWLLTLPLLALLLIAPPPLGSFAAARQSDVQPVSTQSTYPPLQPPVNGAVDLTFSEFVFRALYDPERSLEGQRVRLVGFVSATETAAGDYEVSRFIISCCAADGQAITVAVADPQPPPPVDTWLELEGIWEAPPKADVPETTTRPTLRVQTRTQIPAPTQPYE